MTYAEAAGRVGTMGNYVASFMDFLHENGFIQWERVGIVGFRYNRKWFIVTMDELFIYFNVSLGAHIAGIAGKNVLRGRINHIIGLDPGSVMSLFSSNCVYWENPCPLAGPLFSVNNAANRLDSGDANYVEVLHTNGQTLFVPGSGIGQPIGHADFWYKKYLWEFCFPLLSLILKAKWRIVSTRMHHCTLFSWKSCCLLCWVGSKQCIFRIAMQQ